MEKPTRKPEKGSKKEGAKPSSLVTEIINQNTSLEKSKSEVVSKDIEKLPENPESKATNLKHRQLLETLCAQMKYINIEDEADLGPKEKVGNRHEQFVVAKNIQRLAIKNKWKLLMYNGSVFFFNGEYYQEISKSDMKRFLGKSAVRFGISRSKAGYFSYQEALLRQFMCETSLPNPEPPQGIVLINLKNGTFEVSKNGGKLKPFNSEDFLTYQLNFDYNPEAKAPMFETFINRVLPDKSSQQVLAEFFGYVFVKSSVLKLEKALLMYGEGANGKSVIYDLMNALLGSRNVCNYSLPNLMEPSGYYAIKLATSLLNYSSELGGKVDTDMLKIIISGEPLSARPIYGQPRIITDYAKIAFNTNTLPKSVEHTNAYFRRFLIIPFEVIIPEAEQDKQLAQKIIAAGELSGIFNWVLEGLNRLLKNNGFSECEAAKTVLNTYKYESDTVKMFLDEKNYEESFDKHNTAKFLSDEYSDFCKDFRYIPLNHKNFINRLKMLGLRVENISKRAVVYVEKRVTPSEAFSLHTHGTPVVEY